jgi:hypothetical protein
MTFRFTSIIKKPVETITQKFPDIEVAISGPSLLPQWEPMCIAGHYHVAEKFKRDIKHTYLLKP